MAITMHLVVKLGGRFQLHTSSCDRLPFTLSSLSTVGHNVGL